MTVDAAFDALLDVEGSFRMDDLDRDAVVRLWLDLDHLASILRDLVKLVAEDAAVRLADRDDPLADYVTTQGDVVHLERGYAGERWKGRALVQRMARPFVTVDGEVALAIPVEVVLDVLPGVADDEATSSRWRVTGLRRHVEEWHRYRSRDEAPLVIRRGGAR